MDYLIERKIIKLNKVGNYGDSLVVTGKFGGKNKKQRFANEHVYNKFIVSKLFDKLDGLLTPEQVKEILALPILDRIEELKKLKNSLCV